MKETQEQNNSRLEEILKNFIEQLKGEYKNFSAVISVNNGEGTACLVHGSTLNLMHNVESIETNEAYRKVKKTKEMFDLIKED
jgi:hypothetical protein